MELRGDLEHISYIKIIQCQVSSTDYCSIHFSKTEKAEQAYDDMAAQNINQGSMNQINHSISEGEAEITKHRWKKC